MPFKSAVIRLVTGLAETQRAIAAIRADEPFQAEGHWWTASSIRTDRYGHMIVHAKWCLPPLESRS